MAKKTQSSENLEKKSYEELEKEMEEIMAKLSSDSLGLDESSQYFRQGKAVLKEMEERLDELSKEASDTIANDD